MIATVPARDEHRFPVEDAVSSESRKSRFVWIGIEAVAGYCSQRVPQIKGRFFYANVDSWRFNQNHR
jgi:hypothetical protein